jgi:hypothetical protein
MEKNNKLPVALINPKSLSSFLRLTLGDGIDAAGLIDGKAARILGWEDVDEKRGRTELCWLVTSAASEGISVVKSNRIGCVNVLQGRFSVLLVSFGATCSAEIMDAKLEEIKRVLEIQFHQAHNNAGGGNITAGGGSSTAVNSTATSITPLE